VRDPVAFKRAWLYPLRDLLGFAVWCASLSQKRAVWRDKRYQLVKAVALCFARLRQTARLLVVRISHNSHLKNVCSTSSSRPEHLASVLGHILYGSCFSVRLGLYSRAFSAFRFSRRRQETSNAEFSPRVSVLKPVHGVDFALRRISQASAGKTIPTSKFFSL